MRYILCEDGQSGYYFWSLIKNNILQKHYEMITLDKINKLLPVNSRGKTLSIGVIKSYLECLHKTKSIKAEDTYIVCIDNVMDNISVSNTIQKIHRIISMYNNIHLFDYICFEQLILATGNYEKFIPNLTNNVIYQLIRNHYNTYGMGHSMQLKVLLTNNHVKYKTTETVYLDILSDTTIDITQK